MASQIRASHILLMYQGSMRSTATRSKDEALAMINDLKDQIAKGADLAQLAAQNSDCPSGREGGDLGVFGPGMMVPDFDAAAFALEEGQVSDVVETPFGFHLIQRTVPEAQVRASHILLMYDGSMHSSAERSKAEALAQINAIKADIAAGADFAKQAIDHSDCPSGREGGDLGEFGRGQMVGEFETAVFALDVGQISDVVETPFGYHLIQRTA
ncbi:peptidylprolyl isomerase [Magnetospirillum sulfuroxidans]|uniref:Parvulin-like PPIase n=1 Tax=Magnetospirillum sulfuroxidans TaxID=611300 RepID=A0ABS5I8N8_9PROT|nr:peptidylprolyl isomerase [Magnetospirillum sulfuroxidans]MBR9970777.1 peptidyl-prolyl cis-trans isomerase [Magnetospirillum sulfuroxidans]